MGTPQMIPCLIPYDGPFTNYGSPQAYMSPAEMEIPLVTINSNDTSYPFCYGRKYSMKLATGGNASNQSKNIFAFQTSWNSIATMTSGICCMCSFV
ncbi:MAG: hypothetical protein IPP46_14190 [Bacteroidetes bacterium]|nr:hypothetical protein [Bacteroidota bacterium]